MSQTMTQAEYARRCNVTRAAVNQWKQDGRVVMRGARVDVEASDALLASNRRDGLPPLNHCPPAVRRGRPKRGGLVELHSDAIAARLAALDWVQTFDWAGEAQDERARQAARCVGWVALESNVRDDGHWGGFQVREARGEHLVGDAAFGSVIAGFGFDLSAWEVLDLCREEAGPLEDFATATVRPDLLPVLAHPFDQWDRQRVADDADGLEALDFAP
jgi:transcriptional regulator with XRE-family HTH domain